MTTASNEPGAVQPRYSTIERTMSTIPAANSKPSSCYRTVTIASEPEPIRLSLYQVDGIGAEDRGAYDPILRVTQIRQQRR